MAERDAFEGRFAAALRGYAEEAPTAVDGEALARDLATTYPRRAGLASLGAWGRPALRLAWLVLLIALLAVALVSLVVIGRPSPPAVDRIGVTGSATCAETAPGSASPAGETVRIDGLVTDCSVVLSDPRVSGHEQRRETRYVEQDGSASGTATSELQGGSGSWSGKLTVRMFPNGVRTLEGTYVGNGDDRGRVLVLRAVSGDGRRWSLTGSLERRP